VRIQVTGEAPTDEISVTTGQDARIVTVSAGLVSSVNGQTGDIDGLAAKADVPALAAPTATAAADTAVADHVAAVDPHGDRAAASADATAKLDAHVAAVDPHADRAYADSKFLPLTGGTVNGPLNRNGPAGTYRSFTFQTGSIDRWQIQCDGIAETGTDSGSNLRISARHDDGSDNGVALWISRSTRQIAVNSTSPLDGAALTANGSVGVRDQAADPVTASGGVQLYSKGGRPYLKAGDGTAWQVPGGRVGTATLAAGTVTVSTTAVTANSRIFLTAQTTGGTPGALRVSARTAGTSFTITSTSGTDTSQVAWMIVEPA
jgi:hypothetical protein